MTECFVKLRALFTFIPSTFIKFTSHICLGNRSTMIHVDYQLFVERVTQAYADAHFSEAKDF